MADESIPVLNKDMFVGLLFKFYVSGYGGDVLSVLVCSFLVWVLFFWKPNCGVQITTLVKILHGFYVFISVKMDLIWTLIFYLQFLIAIIFLGCTGFLIYCCCLVESAS
ncbi:hypothetical protein Csa_009679 [Cucumis sativus]|uniref:Uncharacterized protein n=1 Tax=Cucumis sativus TaxID=3659 RepID=A0A0A0L7U5_CUCSA|nr:hypothetical protein Csa_009679 [Cucumis sativus]